MDLSNPYQQRVMELIPIMEERIGRPLEVPVIIRNSRRGLSDTLRDERRRGETSFDAWANPVYIDVNGNWERDLSVQPRSGCLISIGGSGEFAVGPMVTSLLAHEIYHCFQFQLIGWPVVGGSLFSIPPKIFARLVIPVLAFLRF